MNKRDALLAGFVLLLVVGVALWVIFPVSVLLLFLGVVVVLLLLASFLSQLDWGRSEAHLILFGLLGGVGVVLGIGYFFGTYYLGLLGFLGIAGLVVHGLASSRVRHMALLTWKTAVRLRFIWVMVILLLLAVGGLPAMLRDDGSAKGMAQIILTYTLSMTTGILGLSTLWLAVGSMAQDIGQCQMQMVVTKPIARWQIWLGKWLGIMGLNLLLLGRRIRASSGIGIPTPSHARLPSVVTRMRCH